MWSYRDRPPTGGAASGVGCQHCHTVASVVLKTLLMCAEFTGTTHPMFRQATSQRINPAGLRGVTRAFSSAWAAARTDRPQRHDRTKYNHRRECISERIRIVTEPLFTVICVNIKFTNKTWASRGSRSLPSAPRVTPRGATHSTPPSPLSRGRGAVGERRGLVAVVVGVVAVEVVAGAGGISGPCQCHPE